MGGRVGSFSGLSELIGSAEYSQLTLVLKLLFLEGILEHRIPEGH